MKGSIAVAIATGTLVVVACGGFAMAAEAEDPSDPVVAITATAGPEESSGEEASGDASSPDAPTAPDATTAHDPPADENGLNCVLVPIVGEPTEAESTDADPTGAEPVTIEPALEVNAIECGGTGNERSSEVALVPRYLAHSDELSGAEKGAAISAWAKTHANKKSGDEDGDEVPVEEGEEGEETSGDVTAPVTVEPSAPVSPGRSGEAPGHSGSQPGNGKGH